MIRQRLQRGSPGVTTTCRRAGMRIATPALSVIFVVCGMMGVFPAQAANRTAWQVSLITDCLPSAPGSCTGFGNSASVGFFNDGTAVVEQAILGFPPGVASHRVWDVTKWTVQPGSAGAFTFFFLGGTISVPDSHIVVPIPVPFDTGIPAVAGHYSTDESLGVVLPPDSIFQIQVIDVSPGCTLSSAVSVLTKCDFGFETPILGDGNFIYATTGSPWTFSSGSGISSNNSGFTDSQVAPQGVQIAFLQGVSSFSQSISGFMAGTQYTLTFSAAQRLNFGGIQDFAVFLDDTLLGTFTPASTSYQDISVSFSTSTGTHTLTFQGLNTAGGDNTSFIDNIRLG